jgi:TatD DNase family protein
MFDSHCHLTDLDDPVGALAGAQAAGVRSMLTCGYHAESNAAVLRLREQVCDLPIALGLHPWFANEEVESVLQLIEQKRPPVIGELGLDLWGDTPVHPLERQMHVLEAQLQLAVRLNLPVTLHSRKAIDELSSAIRNHPGLRGALHAFSGSCEQLRPLLDLGLYVGVGGAVTRSRAKRVRRCAQAAPLDRIVLETDAPAIGLQGIEPPHVRPAHLPKIAAALAELRAVDLAQIDAQTDQNIRDLIGPIGLATPTVRALP